MISAGEFRNGVTFEQDGQVLQVVEFQHVKPGKGAAFVRTKTKNVITGSVVETLSLIHIYRQGKGFLHGIIQHAAAMGTQQGQMRTLGVWFVHQKGVGALGVEFLPGVPLQGKMCIRDRALPAWSAARFCPCASRSS